jgi:hypothetical protein
MSAYPRTLSTGVGGSSSPAAAGVGPTFRMYAASAQAFTGALVKVALGTQDFATDGGVDVGNSRFIAPVAGYYQIEGTLSISAFSASNTIVALYKNGVYRTGGMQSQANTARWFVTDLVYLDVGDYIELWATPTTAVTGQAGSTNTFLSGFLARRAGSAGDGAPSPIFRLYASATQALASGDNLITLGGESFDTASGAAASAFTAPVAGYYSIEGTVGTTTLTAINAVAVIYKNGVAVTAGHQTQATNQRWSVSDTLYLAVGDVVRLGFAIQTTGMVVQGSSALTYMSGFLINPAFSPGYISPGPTFSAYAATTQAITAATFTKMNLGTEEFDTANCFAASRFTPNVPGYYSLTGSVGFSTSSGGNSMAVIYKNGVALRTSMQNDSASYSYPVAALVYMNGTTDYVELWCHSGGTSRTATVQTHFEGFLVPTPAIGAGPIAFRAVPTGAQTIASSAVMTKVNFGAETFDTANFFDIATSRFTPNVAGYYAVSWVLRCNGSSTMTGCTSELRKNGATYGVGSFGAAVTNYGQTVGADRVYMNGTTDYLEVFGYLIGTGTLQVLNDVVGGTNFSGQLQP